MDKPYQIIAQNPTMKVGEYSTVTEAIHFAENISLATHRDHTVENQSPRFEDSPKILARFSFTKKAA